MDKTLLIGFFASSVILAITPGPDILFVLAESLAKGAKRGILITAGLCLGICMHTLLCAAGISLIIAQTPSLYAAIQCLGAIYLAVLAFEASREKIGASSTNFSLPETPQNGESLPKTLARGFLMNALNPKVGLFFLAFMPQFISEEGLPKPAQFAVLGLVFMVSAAICFCAVSVLAAKFASIFKSVKFWILMKWARALLFASISFIILLEMAKTLSDA
ncbi:MAG: LysE family translocator [Opitutales bacterium]|nr:LysE family translocator [Opitutales bacterium]